MVIGAGIVGASCAYFLALAGLSVTLVDRDRPCAGTSGACDGLLLCWDKRVGPDLELARLSFRLWAELAQALPTDFEYERRGCLMVVETPAGLPPAATTAETMRREGFPFEGLDRRSLLEVEPSLAPDLAGGFRFPTDAQVEPRRATVALIAAARRHGARTLWECPVQAIERDPRGRVSGVGVRTGLVSTPAVVDAAGPWSAEVAGLVGWDLPVRPRKGHIVVVEQNPGRVRGPVLEAGYVGTVAADAESRQVALVAEPTRARTLLLGSSREFVGFDRRTDALAVRAIAARALRFFPRLRLLQAIRTYAGLRPHSPDHLPLIGSVPAVPGFFLATGHEGAGICQAPATGRLIADLVTGRPPAIPVAPYRPARFAAAPR